MLKKPLRRVRRKKGAVLFAVISIMALLIAMASTAYFTAKNAYNSVISNYSYSQLYLSAISVADMVSAAVINDSAAGASATNYYASLRNAITSLNDTITNDSSKVIYAYSDNITDPTATETAILQSIANATGDTTPVPGVLDGVVVKIYVDSIEPTIDPATGSQKTEPSTSPKGTYKFYDFSYTFQTTAYYRGNSIIVEDVIVAMQKQFTPDNDDPDHPNFDTFFTATGQDVEVDADGNPKYGVTERVIKVASHKISDNAYYKNQSTYFVAHNNNDFLGSLTSTGNVYLEKFSTNIQGADNNWWIGGDLVMTNAMSNNLNLTNENTLYVGNDLVIGTDDGVNITAKDIYVEGDIYIMGKTTFNGNLHVTGNIYYQMGATNEDGTPSAATIAAGDGVTLDSTNYSSYANGWEVTGTLEANGKIVYSTETPDWWDESWGEYTPQDAKFKVNGTDITASSGTVLNTNANIGTFDPSSVTIEVPMENGTTGSMSLAEGVNSNLTELSKTDFDAYTSETAYNKTVTVDFSQLKAVYKSGGSEPVDQNDTIDHYESTSNGVTIKTKNHDLEGEITIDLPYEKNGYILDIKTTLPDGKEIEKADLTYNIPAGKDTVNDKGEAVEGVMPIVLAPNTLTDADGDGDVDDPAFSWNGNANDSGDNAGNAIVIGGMAGSAAAANGGDGYVVFEMANIDKDGKYVSYDYAKHNDLTTVTYVTGRNEIVGTEKQIQGAGRDGNLSETEFNTMIGSDSVPNSGYENRVMLVTNMNGGTGYDASRLDNLFCGYVYIPNSQFSCYLTDVGGTQPVLGGMIASVYNAYNTFYYYAEPEPSDMTDVIFDSLKLKSPDDVVPPDPSDDDDDDDDDEGDDTYEFIDNSWLYHGSNYLG